MTEAPSAPPLLEARNLEVVYSDVILVLRGVSLVVPSGGIVALLGANGAGKTTILRALTGLLPIHRGRVTKGDVRLEGQALLGLDGPAIVRRGVSQVMEGRRIFAELTVEENLTAGGFTCPDSATLHAALERIYALFPPIAERRRAVAGYLSGGEQQMVAVGRAHQGGREGRFGGPRAGDDGPLQRGELRRRRAYPAARELETALKDPAVQFFMNTYKASVLSADPIQAGRETPPKGRGPTEQGQ